MGKTNTYWVSFSWTYEFYDPFEKEWIEGDDCEAMRFRCPKKHIRYYVEEYIKKRCGTHRNLKIKIEDLYITSDEEL